jgi:uncharacterized protein
MGNRRVTVAQRPAELPAIRLPAHEILEGGANAGCAFTARSADGLATAGFWSCDVGTYEFFFDYDEFVYLIEGEVIVEDGGESYRLQAGDTAHFPQGITTIWRVIEKMTKYFVAREPFAELTPEE